MSSIRVRPLSVSDRPAWDRLWAGYLAFVRIDEATIADLELEDCH